MDSKHKKTHPQNPTLSDSCFRTIFLQMPFKAALLDLHGYLVDVNEAAMKMYGSDTKKDFIGKSIYEFIDAGHQKKVSQVWSKLIKKGKIENIELVMLKKNNEKTHIILSAKLLQNGKGETSYVIAMAKDITHQKNVESAFKDIAEKYSYLFNNTSDGVCMHDLKGLVLEVNDAYCSMSGYRREELTGKHISKFEALENNKEIAARIKNLIKTGGHDRFESKHRRKDGTTYDVDITLSVVAC